MAEKGLMLWEKVIFVPANIEQRQTNLQNNNSLRLFKPQMCSQSGLGTKNTWSGFRTHHDWHLGMTLTQTSCRPCGLSAHFITTTQTHCQLSSCSAAVSPPLCSHTASHLNPATSTASIFTDTNRHVMFSAARRFLHILFILR